MKAVIILIALFVGVSTQAEQAPQVVRGLIDLSDWHFARDGPINLSGEWQFSWQQHLQTRDYYRIAKEDFEYIEVPGSWNGNIFDNQLLKGSGYATYRVNVLIGTTRQLALKMPDLGTSYRLLVDGAVALTVGNPGITPETTRPRYMPTVVQVQPIGLRIEIILQVSNFHHRIGGVWLPILIGEPQQITRLRENNIATDLLLFGAILIIGLYNLVHFAFRREDASTLFLGGFCLLLALRTLMVGDRFLTQVLPDFPFEWFLRVEYLTWFLAVPLFSEFLYAVFPREFHRRVVYAIHALFVSASLALLVLPTELSTHLALPMQILTTVCLLYGAQGLIMASLRKRSGALLLLFAYFVLFYASVSDILVNAGFIDSVLLLDFGLFVFVFCQSILISYRFTQSFKTIEQQREQLQAANLRLETQEKLRRGLELESKSLEDRVAQSEKMEAIGLLAGGIAHDLNNILSNTVTYPELALLDMDPKDPLYQPLQITREAGLKAAAVIEDLLTLTRRGVVNREVLNLNDVVREYLDSQEHKAMMSGANSIELETSLGNDLHNVEGSPIHLQKVLMNLISNSIEATQDGGSIMISTYNETTEACSVFHGELKTGDYVVLSVEDTGAGIPHDDLDKVFEPFHTTKEMGKSGTGLGMPIVWGVVKDHGGAIDLVSMADMGTRFDIYLPRTSMGLSKKAKPIPIDRLLGKGEKILVVDDESDQRELTAAVLRRLKYEVQICPRGELAVDLVEKQHFDLIMLDMIMEEGWDGLRTFMELQKSHPEQKVIVVTGDIDTEHAKEALRSGVHGFVKKPFTIEAISRAIKSALAL